jgi:hypothetical protein
MVSPRARSTPVRLLLFTMKETFGEVTIEMSRGKALQIPLPGAPTISVFCTDKIHGGQDHAFQFQCGLVNYKAHGDLS